MWADDHEEASLVWFARRKVLGPPPASRIVVWITVGGFLFGAARNLVYREVLDTARIANDVVVHVRYKAGGHVRDVTLLPYDIRHEVVLTEHLVHQRFRR